MQKQKTNITKSSCAIAKNIANKTAAKAKYNIDTEDLYGFLLEKLTLLDKRYSASRGVPFDAFIRRSLAGYALNYLRDNSHIKLPRVITELYMANQRAIRSIPNFMELNNEEKAKILNVTKEAYNTMTHSMSLRNTSSIEMLYSISEPSLTTNPYWDACALLPHTDIMLIKQYALRPDSLSEVLTKKVQQLIASLVDNEG